MYQNTKAAICGPSTQWVIAKKIGEEKEVAENQNWLFKQHANMLNKTLKLVRHRLAALKTEEKEELTLPGGIWKISPTRDNPHSRRSTQMHVTKEDDEELMLVGCHDLPVDLQLQNSDALPSKTSINLLNPTCNYLTKEPYLDGPSPVFSTDYHAALVLRPGVDEEENRKQRQKQYHLSRRLFMDIEREQVKEIKRQKEHEKLISKIKKERELQRNTQERRFLEADQEKHYLHGSECKMLNTEPEMENINEIEEKLQKTKEYVRYVEALRAQMKEKIRLHKIELPPLCGCGTDFWDSHPDACANNCVFYKNPKVYARALQSVISSRDMWDGNVSSRFSASNITSTHTSFYK
ncbi:hypothetical protein GDO86_012870 [Hymenochirus boettgeri]|nr:hypothetical protein GDO86_012870 [Hymenochirus boettgeri]